MRVLHLINTKHLFRCEPVVLGFLGRGTERGHEVALCCLVENEKRCVPLLDEAARLGVPAGLLVGGSWGRAHLASLRERVLDAEVDVLHTHDYRSTLAAARAFRPGEVLRVSTCLGLEVDCLRTSFLARRALRALREFDHVLTVETEVRSKRGQRLVEALGDRLEILPGEGDLLDQIVALEVRMAAVLHRLDQRRQAAPAVTS